MNREMEERIVAMYFDNKDFEKNAKQTIDTLGQLKDGLNLEESAKGFDVFEKIGKTLNFDKANQGLQKMKSGLTTIGDKFKKVFKIGTEPLNEAQGFLKQLQGYMTKYIGFDVAGKIVNSLESSIRSLTIQPISAGWNQYQSKMDSVKTIMSSTGESISNVNAELESMTEYANKTIYSLTDMTSNLGKFTNNGVELNRAVKAMEGIANATADAGQGAQQASMAMYNISQAIGVGKMTTIDWKSLENANIATQKLKNTFLEMAALQGRIEKQTAKDGSITYMLTKDENGNALKSSIQLTAANFREYLSKGWLDKETMLRAFEVYSGTVDENTLESWGIHDTETKKRLMELGEQALESATQVRTFSKMMDALSESVQSGWAQSFELIFGNMEQGTTLWTNINKILDDILSKSAEARNAILKIWAGEDQNVDNEREQLKEKNKQLDQKKQFLEDLEKDGGPVAAVDRQLQETKDAIAKYQQEIKDLQTSDKPDREKDVLVKKRQNKIKELTKTQKQLEAKRGELAKQEKARAKQEEEAAGYQKQIDTYKTEIEHLNNEDVRDSEGDVDQKKKQARDRKVAEKQKKVAELEKKLQKLNSKLGTNEIAQTKKEIAELEKEIDGLNTYIEDKTGHAKSELVDERGRSGRDIAIGALYEIIDVVKELGATISEAFGNVFGKLDAKGLFDFTKRIGDAVHNIAVWFGKLEDEGSRINKIRKGLQGVFSIIKAGIKIVKTIADLISRLLRPVGDWLVNAFGDFGDIFDGIGDLDPAQIIVRLGDKLKAAWEKIKEFFTPKDIFDDKGNYVSTDIPVISWLKKLWGKVKDIVHDWAEENGFIKVYDTVTEWWGKIRSSLGEARETLIDKWMEVKQWFIDSGISQFFSDVWGWVTSLFTPTKHLADENGHELKNQKAPIVTWLSDIWDGIKGIWEQIIAWPVWNTIATFAGNTWAWIVNQFKPTSHLADSNGHELKDQRAPVLKWLSDIWNGIKDVWNRIIAWPVWNTIATFASNTWTWIVNQFKPTSHLADSNGHELKDQRAPVVKWLSGIWEGIKDIWNQIISWPIWNTIATFAGNTWTWLVSRFKPTGHLADSNGHELKDQRAPVVKWLSGIWDGIKETWEKLSGWSGWTEISNFFQNTWGWIVGLFRGNNEGATAAVGEAQVSESTNKNAEEELGLFERIIKTIADFITKVIEAVKGVVIPPAISNFLDNMFKFMEGLFKVIGDVMGSFGKWMNGEKVEGADFWNIFLTIIGGLALVVTSMVNNKFLSNISIANNIGTQILEICGGLLLIASAVALLTTVDQNKLGAAAGVMVTFGIVIAVITGIIAKMSQNNADAPVTAGERILNNLISTLGKVGMLAIVLGALPGIIETIGKVKKDLGGAEIGQDVLDVFLGVTALISGMSLIMAIVQKMTGGTGLKIGATVSTVVSLMAGIGVVLGLFAASGGLLELIDGVVDKIAGSDVDTIGAIKGGMEKVAALLEGVGNAIGSFFKGIAGAFGFKTSDEKVEDSKETIMSLAEFSDVLDTEKIAGISRIMSLMTELSKSANVVDSAKIGSFSEGMESLARGILSMNWIIDGIDDLRGLGDAGSASYKKAEAAIGIVNKLTTALSPMGGVDYSNLAAMRDFVINLGSDTDLLTSFVENLKNIISKLGEVDGEGIQFDGVNIVGKLYKEIDKGLKDPSLPAFDATSIVDAIIKAIGLGDTAIAAFVHEMVQRGIDLSGSKNGAGEFNLDEDTTNLLTKLLGGEDGETGFEFDTTALEKQLYGEDGKGGILGEFTNFEEKIPSLSSMFDGKGWMDFKDENGNEIDILGTLQGKMTELGTTLDTMEPLTIKITPVFDMTNMTPDKLQEALMANPVKLPININNGQLQMSFDGLASEIRIEEILNKLGAITTEVHLQGIYNTAAVNSLAQHMDGIADEVSRLELVLDTGALVGEITPQIDTELYNRSFVSSRTGPVVAKPNVTHSRF